MKHLNYLAAVLPLALVACSGDGADTGSGADLSEEELVKLEQHLRAIPSEERVSAVTPIDADADGRPRAGSAEFAQDSIDAAIAINGPAIAMVRLLKLITKLPPTVYDSDTREFVWGPGDNDNGVGQVLLYIRENGPEEDFKYHYAFVRLVDRDRATALPVIWGGANPDPEDKDKNVGVTLWDFDANNAFDQLHDPAFTLDHKTQGRFVMLYGDDPKAEGHARYNVAVFRDFIPDDAKGDDPQPLDSEYFYGRVKEEPSGPQFDFMDWKLKGDLCDSDPDSCFDNNVVADQDEDFRLRTVFIDKGIGRAEVEVAGGDLTSDVSAVECWDKNLDRTYLSISADQSVIVSGGQCADALQSSLAELGVPSIGDIDADLMSKLTCVADNGIDGDCE
ncbi:MAG: hypothetical protein JW940_24640 [Polyangiaceae bacterium]|nr:hypothetical protein [Polyangiaceae bacterium]